MKTAKVFAPVQRAQKPASPLSKVRPFADAGVKLEDGAQSDPLGEYVQRRAVAAAELRAASGFARKVYEPARTARPADPGTSVPSVQLNRIYAAGVDGAKGTLQETDSVDFDYPEWWQFFYENELVFVRSVDVKVFQSEFSDAVLIPQDEEIHEDSDQDQKEAEDVVPDRHPRELPLNLVGDPDHEARISKVILRGSRTASQHQELMCVLAKGGGDLCLRFSRNNTNDTAQWNAKLSYQDYPVLETHDVDISVGDALKAFRSAHDSIQAYELGDCQAFAEEILEKLGLRG